MCEWFGQYRQSISSIFLSLFSTCEVFHFLASHTHWVGTLREQLRPQFYSDLFKTLLKLFCSWYEDVHVVSFFNFVIFRHHNLISIYTVSFWALSYRYFWIFGCVFFTVFIYLWIVWRCECGLDFIPTLIFTIFFSTCALLFLVITFLYILHSKRKSSYSLILIFFKLSMCFLYF